MILKHTHTEIRCECYQDICVKWCLTPSTFSKHTHTHTLKTSNGSGLFMASAVAWSKASDHSELLLKSQRSERERKKHKLIHLSIHLFNHPTIYQSILRPIHLIHTCMHTYIIHASKQVFIQLFIKQCIIHPSIPLSIHPFNQLSKQLFIQPIIYQAFIIHPLTINLSI